MTPTLAQLYSSYEQQRAVLDDYGMHHESTVKMFQNLYQTLISRLLLDSGKPRFAEKTPGNCRVFPLLFEIFPGSPLIHIIRDGRDVAASLRSQNWVDVRTGKPMDVTVDTRKAIQHWKSSVLEGREVIRLHENAPYLEVFYENLINDPEKELRRLFAFLEEPWEGEVLDFHRVNRNLAGEASATQVNRPLYSSSIGRFTKILNHEDGLIIKEEAGDLLVELGYCSGFDWIEEMKPADTKEPS